MFESFESSQSDASAQSAHRRPDAPTADPPNPPASGGADGGDGIHPLGPSPSDDVKDVPTHRLESDICSLAGHLAAATCQWLVLVGEFDRREAWASWGTRSASQWLSWRCGLTSGTAREHIRVGRALLEFPLIRAAFAAGTLTFSKVRAITRIATPALEAELVTFALGTTAAQIERLVREYRRALNREGPPPTPTPATLVHRWDDEGNLILTIRLPPEDGALVVAALDAFTEILDAEKQAAAAAAEPGGGEAPGRPAPSSDPPECPVLDDNRPRGPVRDAEAFLALVANAMSSAPTDSSGADRFEVVLHADVDQLRAVANADVQTPDRAHPSGGPEGAGEASFTSSDEPTAQREAPPSDDLRHGRCHLHNGPAIYPETLRRMACDSRIRLLTHGPDGSPKDVGRRLRLVTTALRALLEERDGGRCRFPSCDRRRRLHAHHVVHWADGGPTDLDNLILLCAFHHQLVHEHGYGVISTAPGRFCFQRPDGTTIEATPRTVGSPDLTALDPRLYNPPAITDETTTPEWWGDPLHVLDAIDGLIRMRDRAAAAAADVSAETSEPNYDFWSDRSPMTATAAPWSS